ncbi:hypothetical protein [Terrarubrum flagellatum]|uniref:hypothetical protein n=1 Tax=Terrirubrum flagellatum TaxID=2895980 RepID=UPI003144E12D
MKIGLTLASIGIGCGSAFLCAGAIAADLRQAPADMVEECRAATGAMTTEQARGFFWMCLSAQGFNAAEINGRLIFRFTGGTRF